MGIEGDVPPHDGAALLGQFPRKSAVDTDKPIPNELRPGKAAAEEMGVGVVDQRSAVNGT